MPNNDWNALSQRLLLPRERNPILLVLSCLMLALMLSLFSPLSHAATPAAASSSDADKQHASYSALADILQDDKSRAELIAHLREAAKTPASSPHQPAPDATEEKSE